MLNRVIYFFIFTVLIGCSKEEKCFLTQMDLWNSTPIKSYKKCANPAMVYKEKSIPGYQKVYSFQGCGNEIYNPLPEFKTDALKKCVNN